MKTFSNRDSKWETDRISDLCAFCGKEIGWDTLVELNVDLPEGVNPWVHRSCQKKTIETPNFKVVRNTPSVNLPELRRFTIIFDGGKMFVNDSEAVELAAALLRASDMDWLSSPKEARDYIFSKLEDQAELKKVSSESLQKYLLGERGKVVNPVFVVKSMNYDTMIQQGLNRLISFLKKVV